MKQILLLITAISLAWTAQAQPDPKQQEYRKAFNELRMKDEFKPQRQQLGTLSQEIKSLEQAGNKAAAAEKQKEAKKIRMELDATINAKLKEQRPDLAPFIDSMGQKKGPKPGAAATQPPPPPPAPVAAQEQKPKKHKKHEKHQKPEQAGQTPAQPAATPAPVAKPVPPPPAPVPQPKPMGPFVKFPDDLKLTDGTTLKKVTVLERTANQVVLSHSKSKSQTVARKDLTPESQKALGY